jgi:hypothetical protein
MTTLIKYTYSDIDQIINNGFQLELPENTIHYISLISEQVGDPTYVKTPIFHKKNKKKDKGDKNDIPIGCTIEFKSSIFNTESSEDEKILREIKCSINKITSKNYDVIKEQIIENIEKVINLNSDNLKDTCKYIFEYATTSRCNGKTYARLYIELMEKYDVFKEEFNGNFDSYTQLFDKIESTIQGDNYELFCKLNSINEKRKAFSEFISNLVLLDAVDIKNIEEIILKLQNELIYSVEWNNETPKCEEICENLLIFITNLCNKLKDLESWHKIVSNINEVKNLKVNDVISMSNKIKFKHMDMLDAIKKNSA